MNPDEKISRPTDWPFGIFLYSSLSGFAAKRKLQAILREIVGSVSIKIAKDAVPAKERRYYISLKNKCRIYLRRETRYYRAPTRGG